MAKKPALRVKREERSASMVLTFSRAVMKCYCILLSGPA